MPAYKASHPQAKAVSTKHAERAKSDIPHARRDFGDEARRSSDEATERSRDRLQFDIAVPGEVRSTPIPPMLLQPLVENAVKHGVSSCVGRGVVRIAAEREESFLRLTVQDDGVGFDVDRTPRRIGLSNVVTRVERTGGWWRPVDRRRRHPDYAGVAGGMRALVVDDELRALQRLTRLLAEMPGVEVVGEAAHGVAALAAIPQTRPDAVFLDVQMPGLSGFEVLDTLPEVKRPLVVFVTAHDEYALRAFDVSAVDFLVKPVTPDRLARALVRLRERDAQQRLTGFGRACAALTTPGACGRQATARVARDSRRDRGSLRGGERTGVCDHQQRTVSRREDPA